jgi:dTDP-4-amino-4,6-dideoxygalactose transaminase
MASTKIWLSCPHMGGNEQQFVREAFDSNWIAPLGPALNGFEADLQQYTGATHAAALSSGTAALHLALVMLDVQPGDFVICQSMTFSASANPIVYQGATPVFVDSEPDTWNMCPVQLEKAILACISGEIQQNGGTSGKEGKGGKEERNTVDWKEEQDRRNTEDWNIGRSGQNKKYEGCEGYEYGRNAQDQRAEGYGLNEQNILNIKNVKNGRLPKCIIPVHLYGMPACMDKITAVASKYGIPVVEDAAEALGSGFNGKRCGTLGTLGVLSFNGNKIITTSGGGALLSDDGSLIAKARFLATQARDLAPHYQHSHIGYNYRMSNVVAAIGRGQMQVIGDRVAARRANFDRYRAWGDAANKRGYHIEFQPEPEPCFSNRWLTGMLIDPALNRGITRETVRLALEAENIESRPLWKPMHLQPVFSGMPYFGNGLSEKLFENGLCLPSGSNLSDDDFLRIFGVLNALFQ